MKKLILPLPPTDNQLRIPCIRKRRAILVPTPAYCDWKEKCKDLCQNLPYYEPSLESQLLFQYWLYKPNDRSDSQNYEKALRDLLTGKLYKDDKHIILSLQPPVQIDKDFPRVEIFLIPTVFAYKKSDPRLALKKEADKVAKERRETAKGEGSGRRKEKGSLTKNSPSK